MTRREYKLLRQGKDIKQQDIADYCGVSKTLICLYENEKRNMKDHTVAKYKEYIENYQVQ